MAKQDPVSEPDTTKTKVFVGGLAWETTSVTLERYFEQFGEIVEAVVIVNRFNGRSKGYGFVTYQDSAAAEKATGEPNPVIDGRRTNCVMAAQGAKKRHPNSRYYKPAFYVVYGQPPYGYPAEYGYQPVMCVPGNNYPPAMMYEPPPMAYPEEDGQAA
ncbi:hypothetical protein PBRA_008795 [Plasmodiophora brassicae]|nr:hypothetical protein PBRA_008795 [Plasmodiophora brassicae]